ncbi:MAG: nucleotidyltransferase family protein [Bryobacteraceae bacterium]
MTPLLIECCRAHPDPGEIRRLAAQCADWAGFRDAASRHRVAPLAFWSLNRACPDAVPSGVLGGLRAEFGKETRRNLIFTGELLRILECFQQSGIPAVSFKGPALAWSMYPEPGLRCMSDLDVLAPEGDVGRAIDLLNSNGYRLKPEMDLRFFMALGAVTLERTDGGMELDLHWRLGPGYFNPLDAASCWRRLTTVDIAGSEARALCPEDSLALLCLHGAKHGWPALAGICDVDRLIDTTPLDWDTILSDAHRRRMSLILSLGLCLARDLLGTRLPAQVWSRVQADARARELAAEVRARLRQDSPRGRFYEIGFQFQVTEGIRGRLRFLGYLLHPNEGDWETLRLPAWLFPCYYLLRPVRLAWKWGVRRGA